MDHTQEDLKSPRQAGALVEYQTGSVVSRTLLKQPGGTITVFAFDAGQELSEHTSAHDALVHILEGQATISIAGLAHVVAAGELLLLPVGKPHAVAGPARFKMLLTLLRG